MSDVERLRELLAKATPGPWEHDNCSGVGVVGTGWGVGYLQPKSGTICCLNDGEYIENVNARNDAILIAEAITALPDLLTELEAHRARWSRLCALVMTDHRGDGIPTQEATPDEVVAEVERIIKHFASRSEGNHLQKMQMNGDAVAAERERCAQWPEQYPTNDYAIGVAMKAVAVGIMSGEHVDAVIRKGG